TLCRAPLTITTSPVLTSLACTLTFSYSSSGISMVNIGSSLVALVVPSYHVVVKMYTSGEVRADGLLGDDGVVVLVCKDHGDLVQGLLDVPTDLVGEHDEGILFELDVLCDDVDESVDKGVDAVHGSSSVFGSTIIPQDRE